jgi:hypothetical protein
MQRPQQVQERALTGEDIACEAAAPPNLEDLRPKGVDFVPRPHADSRGAELGPSTVTYRDGLLELPESEFTYLAGPTDRPFHHFTSRWKAIYKVLAETFGTGPGGKPFFLVDVGSCNGFFALQAAYGFPKAEVVGVEGSVGIGNGTTGMEGSTQQILGTQAVQTHLKWVQLLSLQNCFVAPEVWDWIYLCELKDRNMFVCDVLLSLSVIHHIEGVSTEQFTEKGLTRPQGAVDLIAKLLAVAPRHVIELPDKPWLKEAYAAYGSQRALLEAAAKLDGRQWIFKGPLLVSEWFGNRELWWIYLPDAPSVISTASNEQVFPQLYGPEAVQDPLAGDLGLTGGQLAPSVGSGPSYFSNMTAETMPAVVASTEVGNALNSAPTALLAAHLSLREAVMEAEDLLREVRVAGLSAQQQRPAISGGPSQAAKGAPLGTQSAQTAQVLASDRGVATSGGASSSSCGQPM